MADHKETLNLPRTEFPMRASLAQREPQWLEKWERLDVHRRMLEKRRGAPPFILHDGPPYANGHIHMGTAYNKVLKDIVVKYRAMQGYFSPFVPGWDCHGQPIEHQVEKDLGPERMTTISRAELRAACREYALRFVDVQREEFKRLGVLGTWEDPYLTLKPAYEAGNVRIFKKLYLDGAIHKGAKPIHWCIRCGTALAEAEIEYADETSDSIYVAFRLLDPSPFDEHGEAHVLIWTTTPWTLPANVAVTLADDAFYVGLAPGDGRVLIVAEALVEQVKAAAGLTDARVVGPRVTGRELAGLHYRLPIHTEGRGVVVTGSHVELTTGTGAVHTAPGHGEEDYLVGRQFGLPMPMPVADDGTFDQGGGPFAGLNVWEANPRIIEWLREQGTLVAAGSVSHSYPHCWRCKRPVIFRATEQWFVSMEATGLRDAALAAIGEVEWIPEWSVNRISAMVRERPDWCISRQRAWGVPIPVFVCTKCGATVADEATFDAVIALFEREGADAWFTTEPAAYLPPETRCAQCGAGPADLAPEDDILDVWWESGVSHTSVLGARPELHRPAQLYLEGSDQHRGWFQSSLLTSVAAYGRAPYERVLTHGFIVDGEGRKMSKSLGNVISPLDVIERSGADIVRLWAASADFGQDISISDEILERTSEAYRRIRNTFRFLLSNLYDFDPGRDALSAADLREVDRWALAELEALRRRVTDSYETWRFHLVYRAVLEYVNELSTVYLDAMKDRLYAEAPLSLARRSCQTVLASILGVLVRVLAPVLSFTCEEVWEALPEGMRDADSVHLSDWPAAVIDEREAAELRETYGTVLMVREAVTKALEEAREARIIGKSQEARLVIGAPDVVHDVLGARPDGTLAELFIVSEVVLERANEVTVAVERAEWERCPRCWNHRPLGTDPAHPDVCGRCAAVLSELAHGAS